METLRIRTAQMNRAKKEEGFLDITIKSGDKVFAPTWNIVLGLKEGRLREYEYEVFYRRMMKESQFTSPARWDEVVASGVVTLGCYCSAGAFCHRGLLADMLREYAESKGYEVIMEGELE